VERATTAVETASVCTPLGAAEVQAAIDRLTRALATAADETIPELVAERAAPRAGSCASSSRASLVSSTWRVSGRGVDLDGSSSWP
jgi:hypothetical protein